MATYCLWVAILVIGAFAAVSQCGDYIDLKSIEEMSKHAPGLLEKIACAEPDSDVCQQYKQDGVIKDNEIGKKWMDVVNAAYVEAKNRNGLANYNYDTNISDYNAKVKSHVSRTTGHLTHLIREQSKSVDPHDFDYTTKRLYDFHLKGGYFSSDEHAALNSKVNTKMGSIFATGQACRMKEDAHGHRKKECMRMEPGLQDLMADSHDYDDLLWAWKGWRDAVGPPIGKLFPAYVALSNEAAVNGGFQDAGDEWRSEYEDPNFIEEVDRLWQTVRPMYLQLHAYVRRKLADTYGSSRVPADGPIPAHLLGNMWAQKWNNLYSLVEPFPGQGQFDVTDEMQRKGWTVDDIFKVANRFYVSIGLDPMPDSFWIKSMLERPKDREVECHGASEDFYKNKDVRIKMCTEITMDDLYTAHHEMGHCEYFLSFRHQHIFFRGSANPGFHEAIGDTIALSVVTPSYLQMLGLLDVDKMDHRAQINYLMKTALDKIAFLPFGLLIDKWRWHVFNGDITPETYNEKWWEMRRHYQGIDSPIPRGPNDFDPGAKYHVASSTPYIRYFVAFIIQFQFQKTLCDTAGYKGALHLCNLYESKEAGHKLASMLQMGMSRPWQDAMEKLTGQRKMDAGPIVEYFKPLIDWLRKENEGHYVGWT